MKKFLSFIVLVLALAVSYVYAPSAQAAVPVYPSGQLAVHRFYNVKTLTHFYSPNESEVTAIRANLPDYKYEGIKYNAYSTPAAGRIAVHRFYNVKTLSHFYSSDQNEVNVVRATLPDFNYEGISYYTDESISGGAGKTVVFRFYNTKTLTHLYTSDQNEANVIRASLRDFNYEGAKFGAVESRYFANCTEADNAGFGRMLVGQVGYAKHLDSDDDGIACENNVNPVVPQQNIALLALGQITGANTFGQELTAGDVTPANANVTYQWQRAATSNGTYTNISGATSKKYTAGASDINMYLRVIVTGVNGYSSSLTSAPTSTTIKPAAVTSIGAISGVMSTGNTLSAGAINPAGATVSYQWQKADTENGTYNNISGATSTGYTLTASDAGKYLRVVATGYGNYSGVAVSSARVMTNTVTSTYFAVDGYFASNLYKGQTLTTYVYANGEFMNPLSAGNYTCQWKRSDTVSGTYTNISGAQSCSYTVQSADLNKFIQLTVTGTGNYSGSASYSSYAPVKEWGADSYGFQTYCGALCDSRTVSYTQPIASCSAYAVLQNGSGTQHAVQATNTGTATCTFEFNAPAAGTYVIYSSATTSNSEISEKTFTESTYRTFESSAALVSVGPISGTAAVGETLSGGWVNPYNATATISWQIADTKNGQYTDIAGASYSSYTVQSQDNGKYIRIKAVGTGTSSGTTVYSDSVLVSDESYNLTSMSTYDVYNPTVGTQMYAGQLTPYSATVNYQWQSSDTKNGVYANIDGATQNSYVTRSSDLGKYVRVVVTGTGKYKGTIVGDPTHNPVADWGEVGGKGGYSECIDGSGICGSFTSVFNVTITACSGGYLENVNTGVRYNYGPGSVVNGNGCTYSYTIPEPGTYNLYYYATTNANVSQQTRLFTGGLNQQY